MLAQTSNLASRIKLFIKNAVEIEMEEILWILAGSKIPSPILSIYPVAAQYVPEDQEHTREDHLRSLCFLLGQRSKSALAFAPPSPSFFLLRHLLP